jgi:hypothetical protein
MVTRLFSLRDTVGVERGGRTGDVSEIWGLSQAWVSFDEVLGDEHNREERCGGVTHIHT